ncbi:hypothetical protein B0H17DRAFT_1021236 [Mycena rosella]|uniref:Uncharacterized protein n=1 Tax=Mycena rosella TaxID=1033263 RepID=A0AAD7G202_MYCRO|nr:hypothetical protein B0H17DRAFT_1021236 [Mycena rosella]
MPRPTPLSNASSPYPRFDTQLTPRTPHSRAGRAEEAYSALELEQIDFDGDDDYNSVVQQQNAPLLSSSASDNFPQVGYRSRGDDYDENTPGKDKRIGLTAEKIIARLPLALYSSVAAVLLVLVFFSLREPETLKKYVVGAPADASDAAAGATPAVDLHPIPTPAADADSEGPRVTLISYENYTAFPLDPLEYRAECIKLNTGIMAPYPYWDTALQGVRDVRHADEQPGYAPPPGAPVCARTITYQLDGWAGLMVDLALVAQAAALARERNATFFVDDRFWNRGKWTDHFADVRAGQPGPEPGCTPPPPEEYVACPRTARHWIVNSRTSRYHFGNGFSENYEDPYGHNLNRVKAIYNFAWLSFQETIRPNARSAELIQWARQELSEKVTAHYQNPRSFKGVQADGPTMGYLGVHIRRGDRNRQWHIYNEPYVPIPDYVDGVVESWGRLNLELSADNNLVQPFVYIASDSPAAEKEFAGAFSPDRVFSLSGSRREELRAIASPGDYFQDDFKKLEEDVRVTATRGMVVDFAVLNGAWSEDGDLIPEGTICAISSVVCKLSAVGLGWQRAFGAVDEMGYIEKDTRRWVDVDTKGRVVPVWDAFQAY